MKAMGPQAVHGIIGTQLPLISLQLSRDWIDGL